jgi:hypothetical protein
MKIIMGKVQGPAPSKAPCIEQAQRRMWVGKINNRCVFLYEPPMVRSTREFPEVVVGVGEGMPGPSGAEPGAGNGTPDISSPGSSWNFSWITLRTVVVPSPSNLRDTRVRGCRVRVVSPGRNAPRLPQPARQTRPTQGDSASKSLT